MPRAISDGLTSSASGTLRMCTLRICSRPQDIRQADHHLAVETARTQQRRIQHVGTVGGGDDDHALVAFKAVHLHQQLVEGLLALVVTTAETGTTMPPDRIDLVDEDDAGRMFLGLFEHVAHTGRAHTDEHLDEIRARDA